MRDGTAPYELQRTVQRYLSQETRHNVIQVILGHPAHLVSVSEFAYYIPKSRSTIREQLADLASHDLLAQYHHEPNTEVRDIPATFWGLTPIGVTVLKEYNYLKGPPNHARGSRRDPQTSRCHTPRGPSPARPPRPS